VVTREAEDGSFEIVYEHVTEPDDGDDDSPAIQSTPRWKNKILLGAAFGVAALVLLAGVLVTVMTVLASNDGKASKVTAADKPEEAKEKPYEYVPPTKNEGRIDLAAEPEQDEAPPAPTVDGSPGGIAPASPTGTNHFPGAPDSLGPSPMPIPRIGDGLKPATLTGAPAMPNLMPRLGDSILERKDIIKPSRTPADGTTDPSDDGSGPAPEENPSGEEEDDDTTGEQEEDGEGSDEEKDDDEPAAEEEEEEEE
jgi:hypothetical protein